MIVSVRTYGFRTAFDLYLEIQESHFYDREAMKVLIDSNDDIHVSPEELLLILYEAKVFK